MANLFQGNQPAQQTAQHGSTQYQLLQAVRQNPRAYVAQIKADPAGFMRQCGYNIPAGMTDPRQIIQAAFGAPPQKRR